MLRKGSEEKERDAEVDVVTDESRVLRKVFNVLR